MNTNIPHILGAFIHPDYPQAVLIVNIAYWSIEVVVTTTIFLIAL